MISKIKVRHLTLMLWSRVATNIGVQAWSHNRLHYNCSGQGPREFIKSLQQLTLQDTQAQRPLQPGGTMWKLVALCLLEWEWGKWVRQETAKFVRNWLGKPFEMHDGDHEANDTDDQDDRAGRDNPDPLSRNEYLRPVILPSPHIATLPGPGSWVSLADISSALSSARIPYPVSWLTL